MTCAACVRRVERALARTGGVQAVSVNLATEIADVTLDSASPPNDDALLAVLQDAGYGGTLLDARGAGANAAGQADAATAQAAHQERQELQQLAACAALSLPLLVPMLLMPFGVHLAWPAWLQCLLATPVQFVFGARFYRGAWHALRAGGGSMDVLVALGTSAAFLLSLALWQMPPPGTHPALYFESAAMVITLVRMGKLLEGHARRSTASALRALQHLQPQQAEVLGNGHARMVPVGSVQVGDLVRVGGGQQVPVDGVVLEGHSALDLSLVTGESLPQRCAPGDALVGGSLNGDGVLVMRATAVGHATRLANIIRLVETAQAAKPRIQQQVDRISAVFVPVVVAISGVTLLAWGLQGSGWTLAVLNAVAVLVIACPCALGLATPAAILVGTGLAARRGILIRDARALDDATAIDVVVFDKTGTLTEGHPAVTCIVPAPDQTRQQVLAMAGGLQAGSQHPLARATLQAATSAGVDLPACHALRNLPGLGVQGTLDGGTWQLGSTALLEGLQPAAAVPPALAAAARQETAAGHTLAWLVKAATPGSAAQVAGLLGFADPVRQQAAAAVRRLQVLGLRVVMLSGDHQAAVRTVAATGS